MMMLIADGLVIPFCMAMSAPARTPGQINGRNCVPGSPASEVRPFSDRRMWHDHGDAAHAPRRVPARLFEHRLGQVDADDLRLGKTLRQPQRARTCSGADVEDARRRVLQRCESRFVRRERVLEAHRVPDGRERIELPAHKGTKELPQQRVAHRGVSREAREASPDCHPVDHVGSKRIRTSRPGFVPSIAAALPPLIAIDRLR